MNGLVSDMFAQSAEGGAESLELGDDVEGDDDVGNGSGPAARLSVALEGDVAGTSGSGVKQREVDPSWEPNDITLTLYVTRSFGLALDQVAAKLRLSKSLLLREAVRRGLPELVERR